MVTRDCNTRRVAAALLDDEEYRALVLALVLRPETGRVISGSGGLRKIRWSTPGQGKRGGRRVIFYWDEPSETCDMLSTYSKQDRDHLTAEQLRTLSHLVCEEFS
jgi:hypothetical protein